MIQSRRTQQRSGDVYNVLFDGQAAEEPEAVDEATSCECDGVGAAPAGEEVDEATGDEGEAAGPECAGAD